MRFSIIIVQYPILHQRPLDNSHVLMGEDEYRRMSMFAQPCQEARVILCQAKCQLRGDDLPLRKVGEVPVHNKERHIGEILQVRVFIWKLIQDDGVTASVTDSFDDGIDAVFVLSNAVIDDYRHTLK
ncbi:hypothetical protein C6Y55_09235 [Stenotrophomonas maltophilia]|nr:hypothetical protein C6Y55_09235 [Stenotrophomonas maltophilia]